jgi:hypothetical protein
VDEKLKRLVRELGEAINSSVNDSQAVNDALDRIRETGNDVFLVLEATIAFKHPPRGARGARGAIDASGEPAEDGEVEVDVDARLNEISSEDRQFLKSLRISFDDGGE